MMTEIGFSLLYNLRK